MSSRILNRLALCQFRYGDCIPTNPAPRLRDGSTIFRILEPGAIRWASLAAHSFGPEGPLSVEEKERELRSAPLQRERESEVASRSARVGHESPGTEGHFLSATPPASVRHRNQWQEL